MFNDKSHTHTYISNYIPATNSTQIEVTKNTKYNQMKKNNSNHKHKIK
jgi:hypothetical protein